MGNVNLTEEYKEFALTLNEISKHYGFWKSKRVLSKISINLGRGRCLCIVGENGAGKSTLLKVTAGLIAPNRGNIRIYGKISYVPEVPAFFPYLSAAENLEYYNGIDRGSGKYTDLMEKFNIPMTKQQMHTFSKGMKRKVDIIRAVNQDPSLLVLDEPFDGIDPSSNNDIVEIMKRLKEGGASILMSSHDMGYIERVADEVMLLKDGSLVKLDELRRFKKFLVVEGEEDDIENGMKKFKGEVVKRGGEFLICLENDEDASGLLAELLNKGVKFKREEGETLEHIYLKSV